MLTRPLRGNHSGLAEVIDHKDELVVVIAIEHLDVHTCLNHSSGDLSQLAGFSLIQPHCYDIAHSQDANIDCFERSASSFAIGHEEVSESRAGRDKCAATFDAHTAS